MAQAIVMPDLGESVIEGTILSWHKAVGDMVQAGDVLVEVDTDKVTTEVVSRRNGVLLAIAAVQDAVVEVGAVLGYVGAVGEAVESPSSTKAKSAAVEAVPSASKPRSSPTSRKGRNGPFVSPVVARMVAMHALDLTQIRGTGRNGRVRKKDVLAFMEQAEQAEAIARPQLPAVAVEAGSADYELIPLTPMRRAIAKRMSESKSTIPHVTAVVEVDLSRVAAHRREHKAAFAQDEVKLTYMAYVVVAVARALRTHRMVNASWRDDGIALHRAIHLGIATDLGERGLMVPVMHNAADLSLLGAARMLGSLAQRARDGSLKSAETRGATYTITNYGSNGTLHATPIISPPQCAILGVGKIEDRPVVRQFEGEKVMVIRPMAYLSHTYDHRIVDGGTSSRFLRDVIEMLETWR